jgi:two-component system sensor histidine kinase MtrB
MENKVRAGRLRRRLTVAFLLVSGISAATIGLGAFLLVRDARTDDFVTRSVRDARANYLMMQERGPFDEQGITSLVKRFERRAVDATVVTAPGGDYTSATRITREDIPASLSPPQERAHGIELSHRDVTASGAPYLVVATPSTEGVTMYFFYSMEALEKGLGDLASITWRLWLVVVIAAALVGNALARRTLRPVSRASAAAQLLAEGLLDTRLPIEREDEFGAWAVSFNEMADALQRKVSELIQTRDRERQFTSDVSHELRTPLTSLVSSASMLEQRLHEMEPETRWMSKRIIREARRMRALVDGLLEISRLHSGHEVIRRDAVDLGMLVGSIIKNEGWERTVAFRSEAVVVSTDKARAERIVVNLISNSVEHGREAPEVRVGLNGRAAFVEVGDQGTGITPEHISHVFERFYKADPSRPGGSGLGLAIAAENARLLGGTIAVSSEHGRGATFTLRLPATETGSASVDEA